MVRCHIQFHNTFSYCSHVYIRELEKLTLDVVLVPSISHINKELANKMLSSTGLPGPKIKKDLILKNLKGQIWLIWPLQTMVLKYTKMTPKYEYGKKLKFSKVEPKLNSW